MSPCRTTRPTALDVLAGRVTVVGGPGRTGWGLAVLAHASKIMQFRDYHCILLALLADKHYMKVIASLNLLCVSLGQISFLICQFVPV